MNATLVRAFISKSVLLAAASGAVWYLAVRPMKDELRQARAAYESLSHEIDEHRSTFGNASFDADAVVRELKGRRSLLEARFTDSADPAQVYDKLGTLAASTGVRLERVEPGKGGRGLVSQCPEIVVAAVHTIEATGTMAQLSDFFAAIDGSLGMSRVGTVRLSPVAGSSGEQLTATIETTHLRLNERASKPNATSKKTQHKKSPEGSQR